MQNVHVSIPFAWSRNRQGEASLWEKISAESQMKCDTKHHDARCPALQHHQMKSQQAFHSILVSIFMLTTLHILTNSDDSREHSKHIEFVFHLPVCWLATGRPPLMWTRRERDATNFQNGRLIFSKQKLLPLLPARLRSFFSLENVASSWMCQCQMRCSYTPIQLVRSKLRRMYRFPRDAISLLHPNMKKVNKIMNDICAIDHISIPFFIHRYIPIGRDILAGILRCFVIQLGLPFIADSWNKWHAPDKHDMAG